MNTNTVTILFRDVKSLMAVDELVTTLNEKLPQELVYTLPSGHSPTLNAALTTKSCEPFSADTLNRLAALQNKLEFSIVTPITENQTGENLFPNIPTKTSAELLKSPIFSKKNTLE